MSHTKGKPGDPDRPSRPNELRVRGIDPQKWAVAAVWDKAKHSSSTAIDSPRSKRPPDGARFGYIAGIVTDGKTDMTPVTEALHSAASSRKGPVPYPDADLLFLGDLLTEAEQQQLKTAREFFQSEVRTIAVEYWNRAEFPFELLPKLATLQLSGGKTESHLLAGLIQMELARADTSVSTFFGVHHDYLNGETFRMDGALRMAPR